MREEKALSSLTERADCCLTIGIPQQNVGKAAAIEVAHPDRFPAGPALGLTVPATLVPFILDCGLTIGVLP